MGKKFDISKFASSLAQPPAGERDIETITAEIVRLKQDAGNAILGIGQRLNEAKALLSDGEWLVWLSERVDFSPRTAQRFMRLAREWSDATALSHLGATKALTLLALPPEERDAFIAGTHTVNGEEKTIIDMTSRELEKAIRERDEARQAMETAQAAAQAAEDSRLKMEADMVQLKALQQSAQQNADQAREELDAAQKELEDLRNKPVEVAVETVVDQEAVRKAREDAIAGMQAKVDAAEAGLKKAEQKMETLQKEAKAKLDRAMKAETELAETRRKLEVAANAEKQTAIDSDSELTTFRVIFDQTQGQVNQLHGIFLKIRSRDEIAAEKLKKAMLALAEAVRRCAE